MYLRFCRSVWLELRLHHFTPLTQWNHCRVCRLQSASSQSIFIWSSLADFRASMLSESMENQWTSPLLMGKLTIHSLMDPSWLPSSPRSHPELSGSPEVGASLVGVGSRPVWRWLCGATDLSRQVPWPWKALHSGTLDEVLEVQWFLPSGYLT